MGSGGRRAVQFFLCEFEGLARANRLCGNSQQAGCLPVSVYMATKSAGKEAKHTALLELNV